MNFCIVYFLWFISYISMLLKKKNILTEFVSFCLCKRLSSQSATDRDLDLAILHCVITIHIIRIVCSLFRVFTISSNTSHISNIIKIINSLTVNFNPKISRSSDSNCLDGEYQDAPSFLSALPELPSPTGCSIV